MTQPDYSRAQGFGQHLIEVHNMFRQGLKDMLAEAERLASSDGNASDGTIEPDPEKLSLAKGDLRQFCLQFCMGLHHHHTGETMHVFPAIREAVPSLGPVIDRLDAEHEKVRDYLDKIEAVAGRLTASTGSESFAELHSELKVLSEQLLKHLSYEEEQLVEILDNGSR